MISVVVCLKGKNVPAQFVTPGRTPHVWKLSPRINELYARAEIGKRDVLRAKVLKKAK